MSREAFEWVWKESPYEGARLLVHLAVADIANAENGWLIWASTETIAKLARCARSMVTSTLKDLIAKDLLERVESGKEAGEPSTYRLKFRGVRDQRAGGARSQVTNEFRARAEEQVIVRDHRAPLRDSRQVIDETRAWPKTRAPWLDETLTPEQRREARRRAREESV